MIQNRNYNDIFVPKKMNKEAFWNFICDFDLFYYCRYDEDEAPVRKYEKYLLADDLECKLYHIDSISIFLSIVNRFFKPFLHRKRIDIIIRNSKILGMDLPPIPRTDNYKDLFLYYYDICEIWNKFQRENLLSDDEFCVCLYGFASALYYQQQNTEKVLLPPTNHWLIGCDGDSNDYEDLEAICSNKHINNDFACVCSDQIKHGDVILIYFTKPYCFVHSICRANADAFYTPFDEFKTRTTICNPQKITPIRFEDIKNNECLMQNQATRIKFKRKKCVQLTSTEYQEFLKIVKYIGG